MNGDEDGDRMEMEIKWDGNGMEIKWDGMEIKWDGMGIENGDRD